MVTRRSLLLATISHPSRCYCLCGFDGTVFDQPIQCEAQPPGSTVKPLLSSLLQPSWRFACKRTLRVGGRRLDCAHAPLHGPLDFEVALASSCNSWFAQAAERLEGAAVQRVVQGWGGRATTLDGKEQVVLAFLGLQSVWFTPATLARAYARLRREASPSLKRGLEMAVESGTAAKASGSFVAGKTGTVREGAWFAGWSDRAVIAVFVPGGTGGGDAAPAAAEIMSKWHSGHA